ncbi:MAG: DUF1490 domain-containing protein [Defluviitaleaceae bacterium]|nr:DUF1490 domain-containing protein [Defluviitaleaceae bacterium]
MNLLMCLRRKERLLLFAGGVAATLYGMYFVKSGKAKNVAVKGIAGGIQLQKKAYETFQNIKEEAADVVHDANRADDSGSNA